MLGHWFLFLTINQYPARSVALAIFLAQLRFEHSKRRSETDRVNVRKQDDPLILLFLTLHVDLEVCRKHVSQWTFRRGAQDAERFWE